MSFRFARIALGAALAAATVGCANNKARVFVNYDQVANFYEYLLSQDSSLSHGAGDGRLIMYKVTQINDTAAAGNALPNTLQNLCSSI